MKRNRLLEETPRQRAHRDAIRDGGDPPKNHPLDLPRSLRQSPWERFKEDTIMGTGALFLVLSPLIFLALMVLVIVDLAR